MQKLRPYLNKVATPGFTGRCSTELVPLLPREGVDRDFLAHLLRRRETVDFATASVTGTRMPRTDMNALMSMRVPFPPFDEQRRIVSFMDGAVRIGRLRTRAADRLQEFAQALFIKMFGDPVENPMGWELRRLDELTEEFRYGTSKKCHDNADDNKFPILRIPNILNGSVNLQSLKFTSLSVKEFEKLRLQIGDLLFVRTNGNPDYIGRCAVFNDPRRAAYASYLIRARLKSGGVIAPEYVAGSFTLPTMRKAILQLVRTTAGNYNINIENLGSIQIPVPSMNLQQKYSTIVANTRRMTSTTETVSQASFALSASLGSRLLAGYE